MKDCSCLCISAVHPRIPGGCDPLHFNIRGYT